MMRNVFPISRIVAFVSSLIALSWSGIAVADSGSEGQPDGGTGTTPTNWYVSAVISGRSGFRITHLWSKGAKLRSETMLGSHPITTIVRGRHYWIFDRLTAEGIDIERSPQAVAEDGARIRPFGNDLDEVIRAGGEKVEETELSGIPAEVWRVTSKKGRRTVWVTASEPRVPLRVENFDRDSGESVTLDYSGWSSPKEIPDAFFEPPSDLRITRIAYEAFAARTDQAAVGRLPILHPALVHGTRPD